MSPKEDYYLLDSFLSEFCYINIVLFGTFFDDFFFKMARFGLAHLSALVVNEALAPPDLFNAGQPPASAG